MGRAVGNGASPAPSCDPLHPLTTRFVMELNCGKTSTGKWKVEVRGDGDAETVSQRGADHDHQGLSWTPLSPSPSLCCHLVTFVSTLEDSRSTHALSPAAAPTAHQHVKVIRVRNTTLKHVHVHVPVLFVRSGST